MSSPEKEKLNVDISTLLYWCVVGEKHVSGKGDFLRWAVRLARDLVEREREMWMGNSTAKNFNTATTSQNAYASCVDKVNIEADYGADDDDS
jgi:hypothetical protein